ncbi:oligosaccharide repeat unit polymerase [Allobacillus sp. SKP2-8]|uniref:O-antigen polymerase n=1 Tax=unclassified Allobacillus TaxID=2628859 RepID=UPI0011828742|nr:O-antigen polymerase [Allobacillus sp. SKP2-8]TSJ62548.1 oligosaccharide repeat unit polymerase [Allobacillus sp. SKP2-8]
MALFLSLLCVLMLIVGNITEKKFYNPLTLFSALWAIILFGSHFELFGFTGVTSFTYLIILIGIVSYFIGYYSFKLISNKNKLLIRKPLKYNKKHELNIMFSVILVVSLVVLIMTTRNSVTLLLQGYTLHDIRYIVGMDRFNSGVINILFAYIVNPFTILVIPISAFYFYKEKRNLKYLYIAIILIVLNIITDGGRFVLLYIIINYIVAYFIMKKTQKQSFKFKRKVSLYLIVLFSVFSIVYVTLAREASILETIYSYLIGAVSHLSYRLETFDNYNLYTYGFSSLQGFVRPLFVVLQNIGFNSLPELVARAEDITMALEEPVLIGEGVRFNAFITMFYYFYIDLGILGVTIGSFLYGILASFSYFKVTKEINLVNVSVYLLIVQSLLTSMVRFQFSSFSFALCFVYLFIITSSIKSYQK